MISRSFTKLSKKYTAQFSTYEKTFLAEDMVVHTAKQFKPKPGPEHKYTFGGITTDYMLEIDFDRENGGW
jgi:hypothetical protein